MVIETSRPIAQVAKELGINEGTVGNWVNAYKRDHAGEEPPFTVSERARLREQERLIVHSREPGWRDEAARATVARVSCASPPLRRRPPSL
jgi:transposase-like protein